MSLMNFGCWVLLQDAANPLMQTLPMLLIIFAIFYFLLIRPQARERKKQEAMRNELKKGDEILTQSGIVGTVHSVRDRFIILELEGSARMKVVRDAVVRKLGDEPETPASRSSGQSKTDAKAEAKAEAASRS